MKVFLVMFGGFLGTICRFAISNLSFLQNNHDFPFATLIVNLLGSLVLGWLAASHSDRHPNLFLFFGAGLIGSFTTFSTFSYETLILLEKGEKGLALAYVLISLLAGICLSFIGYKLAFHYKQREGRSI